MWFKPYITKNHKFIFMLILSNAFSTNLPNSEQVSCGGPANFARSFVNYILENHSEHAWLGLILDDISTSSPSRLYKVFSSTQRNYFKLRAHKNLFKSILYAKENDSDPRKILNAPILRTIKLIKKEKPDVIFLNGFGILNWMLLKAGQESGVPVVIQHAGIWTKELTLHKDRYSTLGLKILKNMEKESTSLVQKEIFLNLWSKDYYCKNVAEGSEQKTVIIPLPFNFQGFEEMRDKEIPSKFIFNNKVMNVGIIARWDKIKNHPAVLKMATVAKKKNLPLQFHSVVEIPNRKEFEKERLKYAKYINIVLPQDRVGISNFCQSVDMLILPSLFDVSPTVVLEAIATETPIMISSHVGYVNDFENYGGKAWIIDTKNVEQAVDQILALKDKKMPQKLKDRIIFLHDHNKVFAHYIKIFEDVIKNKP